MSLTSPYHPHGARYIVSITTLVMTYTHLSMIVVGCPHQVSDLVHDNNTIHIYGVVGRHVPHQAKCVVHPNIYSA